MVECCRRDRGRFRTWIYCVRLGSPTGGEAAPRKQFVIHGRTLASSLVPAVELFQLHVQDGSLHSVKAAVPSQFFMQVSARAAVVAQAPHLRCQLGVIRSHQAGFPIGTEILGGIKAESSCHARGSGATIAPSGPDGLGSVFNHRQMKLAREYLKAIQIGALAIQMDGKQRPQLPVTAAPQMGFDLRWIEIEGSGTDVGKYRTCSGSRNRASGSEETEGSGKNLVSGLHAGGDQGERKSVRSRRA